MNISGIELNTMSCNYRHLVCLIGSSMPLISIRINIWSYEISLFMILVVVTGTMIFLTDLLQTKKKLIIISPLEKYIFTLPIIMLLSLFYTMNTQIAIISILKYFFLIVMFYLATEIFVYENNVKIVMQMAVYSSVAFIIYLSYHFLYIKGTLFIGLDIEYGSKAGRNSLALMVLIIVAFTIGRYYGIDKVKDRRQAIITMPLLVFLIISMFLIQSRGALVAAIASSLILWFIINNNKKRWIKRLLIVLSLFCIIVIVLAPDELRIQSISRFLSVFYSIDGNSEKISGLGSINVRQELIRISLQTIQQKLFFGIGFGSFKDINPYSYATPHNDYLLFAVELGIVGFLGYCALVFSFIRMAYSNYKYDKNQWTSGMLHTVIAFSIYSLFISAYDNFLIWAIFAMILGTHKRIKINQKSI